MLSKKTITSWLIVISAITLLSGCGINTVVQVGTRVIIPPNGTATAAALCPDGMIATGGGFTVSNKAVVVTDSAPKEAVTGNTPIGWLASATNNATFDVGVAAYAVCTDSK